MPHPIVEIREGGAARAAAVLADSDGRLTLLLADGKQMRVPPSRVVHDAGDAGSAATESALRAFLTSFEREATTRAAQVDLAALHELLSSQVDAGLTLGDLAALGLGEDSPVARAGVHRAMAAPNPHFKFTGNAWVMRSPEEIAAELERERRANELEQERTRFLIAARARLAGGSEPLPAGCAKFLRPLRDVALMGEAAKLRKEAAAAWAELRGREPGAPPNADEAIDALVSLGVFHRDENLALLRAGVRVEFPPDVLEEAERLALSPLGGDRLDLRGLDIVTIDDVSTLEVDDGLSLETTPRGIRLGIHISDAAHFVALGSLTDDEALLRATSYYLPERSVRMLPKVLSEKAASLVAGEDRPALTFFVELTPHGEILGFEIRESLVRVTRRMTYEDCEDCLPIEGAAARVESDVAPWLPTLSVIAGTLEQERLAAGATPIRAAEISISFDAAGEPLIELIDPGRPARKLVSEMMILANHLVAAWCRDRGIPAIYRKQGPPTGSVARPPLDRMDPVAANEFRRTLQRTEVSLEPGPHAGLGVPAYLQSTSPLRRYQDLAVHRIIKASLAGQPLPYTREQVQGIATSTELAGRTARHVETETDHYWVLRFLEKRIGETLPAIVLRTEDRRTWIELLDLAHQVPLAPRPDHAKGQRLDVRVRAVKPRRGVLTLEQVTS